MEKKQFPPLLSGQRFQLRRHDVGNVKALASTIFSLVERDRERLGKFLPWVDLTKTWEDEVRYIEMAHQHWEEFKLFDYGIYRQPDDCFAGNIGIHSINWTDNHCEIGYWLAAEFEGQGYISEAVGMLEREAFTLGFQRVEIRCSARNERSANVPIRCGYTLEGTLRQIQFMHGVYYDTLVFARVRSDLR